MRLRAGADKSKYLRKKFRESEMAKSKKSASADAPQSNIRAVIDRIEDGGIAVVLLGDDEKNQINIPLAFLPPDATDGDHLNITFALDAASKDATAERIKKLQDQLAQASGAQDQKDFKL
jgi:hypothetical protein